MRDLTSLVDVVDASGDDPLVVWAAQGLRPAARVWAHGDAVGAACPDLIRANRMAVRGSLVAAKALVRHAFQQVGPTYKIIGEAGLIVELVAEEQHLTLVEQCVWMEAAHLTPPRSADEAGTRWLDTNELEEVQRLLAASYPTSRAQPGVPGVRRWGGRRDACGRLVAAAADAWTATGVGFIAGVTTEPQARGRGHASSLCRFTLESLINEQGRVALIVDDWNTTAIHLYQRLGMRRRAVAIAAAIN